MGNSDISVVYEYLNHLASFGGNMWNVDGNKITPNLESSECVDALENYVRFQPYADPALKTSPGPISSTRSRRAPPRQRFYGTTTIAGSTTLRGRP